MKYLIMCEGPNELEIIRILLEYDKLIFTEDDLLNLVPYHARSHGFHGVGERWFGQKAKGDALNEDGKSSGGGDPRWRSNLRDGARLW